MAGYWKNEKATAETIRDGWLYTGDLGYLDEDGFLYVLGRTKSLLIANDGEKYSPEVIEEAITEGSPYIEQFMLYNNQSPLHGRPARPEQGGDPGLAEGERPLGQDARRPGGGPEAPRRRNRRLPRRRHRRPGRSPPAGCPRPSAVLGEGFTEQNHLMNSTMKMVRGKIADSTRAGSTTCSRRRPGTSSTPRTGRSSAVSADAP